MPAARRYDRSQVESCALQVRCMAELLDRLGVESTPRVRRNMRSRLARWRIDTTHWDRSPRYSYGEDLLATAVRESTSIAGVLRILGIPLSGGQHAHIARRIRAAGIDTSHFLGQASNRGQQMPRKRPELVLVVLPEGSPRPKAPTLRNALRRVGVAEVCALCGCDGSWNGRPLRLVIDHVNGDWLDNRIENLRFLCPNCHAQTSTWCRKRSARSTA